MRMPHVVFLFFIEMEMIKVFCCKANTRPNAVRRIKMKMYHNARKEGVYPLKCKCTYASTNLQKVDLAATDKCVPLHKKNTISGM